MNGEIAQIISLFCNLKSYINTSEVEVFEKNSTCVFCETITFVTFKTSFLVKKTKEKQVANNANDWFKYIAQTNPKNIKLCYSGSNESDLPDHISSAFVGGGGQWYIEVIYDNGFSDIWISNWDVGNQDHPDKRFGE